MLGILLIYWIGKYYYNLADEHDKRKWGFAFLGIGIYYAGLLSFGFLIGVILSLIDPSLIERINEYLLAILALPGGILTTYAVYKYLEKKWAKEMKKFDHLKEEVKAW